MSTAGRLAFALAGALIVVLAVAALSQGPDNTTVEPTSGGAIQTEAVVWLEPGIAEVDALIVGSQLVGGPGQVEVVYVDSEATYDEFQEFFAGETELLEMVEPADLPTSFNVLVSGNPGQFVEWAEEISGVVGVDIGSRDEITDRQRDRTGR